MYTGKFVKGTLAGIAIVLLVIAASFGTQKGKAPQPISLYVDIAGGYPVASDGNTAPDTVHNYADLAQNVQAEIGWMYYFDTNEVARTDGGRRVNLTFDTAELNGHCGGKGQPMCPTNGAKDVYAATAQATNGQLQDLSALTLNESLVMRFAITWIEGANRYALRYSQPETNQGVLFTCSGTTTDGQCVQWTASPIDGNAGLHVTPQTKKATETFITDVSMPFWMTLEKR